MYKKYKRMNKQIDPCLSCMIGHLFLPTCIYNASGVNCITGAELTQLYKNKTVGAIVSKSCTLKERKGNEKPRYFSNNMGSINSSGLPNKGYHFYQSLIPKYRIKPYIISVSGLSFIDNLHIIQSLVEKNVAGIELNLSCPNIIGKPQIGYDFADTEKLLQSIYTAGYMEKTTFGCKLPPYFDPAHFDKMSYILNKFPIKFVTCINSLGNGLIIDSIKECTTIKPKNGLGGIGGSYCKPIALSNVYSFRKKLRDDIAIIGCGGIRRGRDAYEHILAGATAVQVGTQLYEEGIDCIPRILKELEIIMRDKRYATLDEFRGKLKTI